MVGVDLLGDIESVVRGSFRKFFWIFLLGSGTRHSMLCQDDLSGQGVVRWHKVYECLDRMSFSPKVACDL